jgi:hypothetical protein
MRFVGIMSSSPVNETSPCRRNPDFAPSANETCTCMEHDFRVYMFYVIAEKQCTATRLQGSTTS